MKMLKLTRLLLLIGVFSLTVNGDYPYVSYNGMYNNPSNLHWGSTGSPLLQPLRPYYSDSSHSASFPNRASPRTISLGLFSEEAPAVSSKYTALLPAFMEFLDHDILDLRPTCPPEDFSIPVAMSDPIYGNKTQDEMPDERVKYATLSGAWADFPRQQINSVTSWIDGSQVYGVTKGWADILRSGEGGKLKTDAEGTYPALNDWGVPLSTSVLPHTCLYPDVKKLYLFGDPRSNTNPALFSLHWLFFREHNRRAAQLQQDRGPHSDKWLFDKSRYLTLATLQKIAVDAANAIITTDAFKVKDYERYITYTPTIDPGVNILYAGAVRYFFLTMVPDVIYVSELEECRLQNQTERLCNYYWDAQSVVTRYSPEALLRGMAYQPAGKIDKQFVKDIRSSYYGPLHWTRRDGVALAIQRGRDLGVPPLNSVLAYYNEPAMQWTDWEQELQDPDLVTKLRELYNNDVNEVELFVGGMLLSSGEMWRIFQRILQGQIESLRAADRFWFKNPYNGLGCAEDEIKAIDKLTIKELLKLHQINLDGIDGEDLFKLDHLSKECKDFTTTEPLPDCQGEMMLHYNYNTTPYALPLLIPAVLLCAVVLVVVLSRVVYRQSHPKSNPDDNEGGNQEVADWGPVKELQSRDGDRHVEIYFDIAAGTVICNSKGKRIRTIYWKRFSEVSVLKCANKGGILLVVIPKEYDLMLKFKSPSLRDAFCSRLADFSNQCNVPTKEGVMSQKLMLKIAKTEAHRQHLVETFLSSIFSEIMAKETGVVPDGTGSLEETVDKMTCKGVGSHVLECELSRAEFASVLGMRPDQEFVEKVFPLVDRDGNGSISFREFLSFMIVYSSGSSADKLKLIFNMYDYDKNGSLHVDEIKAMIRSMLEMVSASIDPEELNTLATSLFVQADFQDKTELTFEEFQVVMAAYKKDIEQAQLEVKRENVTQEKRKIFTLVSPKGRELKRYIENHRLEIFYSVMFLLVVGVLFTERFITYTKYKHHTGYPQLLGYALSLTRGSAAVIMFTFPLFLVLMCKNIITHLRGTFLKRYIPLDSNRTAHIHLGMVSLVFILIHCIGHGYNFYMVSTLSPDHLACLMPRTWLDGQGQATVVGLLFGTITGITGILLVLLLLALYICATEYARRNLYPWFWKTHHFYPAILGLTILHGTARLLQEPTFHLYLVGPAVLFTLDKLVSISRKKREIPLIEANILPSEVTNLVFKRPVDFHYLAGQYVKIALVNSGTGRDEYHPFTLTSAPHEDTLSVHIRTCKGWTKILRDLVIQNEKNPERNPNLYVDGPFGEAHQDYSNYEVVILVGGGIGVTPFASILKDLVHKASSTQSTLSQVKKVYFLWSTRSQRQFEWLLDIIGKCEEEDKKDLLDTHIFITRFYEKSDLRTTMLYICERQFQGISNRSLFTGLKAVTHFGRPSFDSIFNHIGASHSDVKKFGVFVCGPPTMSDSVKFACSKITGKQTFVAYAENF